ncbi:secretory phospholipase A2 receptor-like [Trachinotus anak]|uniref:secretory phospholipase A2 receptor-like n=1 Tax=Trachinotus anak TaxID=443729 RepID=UPI0039F25B3D
MGNKSSPELTLSFLLIAALCLEALIVERFIYLSSNKMTWTEGRLFCQRKHIDLITWNLVNTVQMTTWLVEENVTQIWIGLRRDPEEDSLWKWINVKTGEGVSGDDLSQSSNWADGQQSGHCAVVGDDLMWYSAQCSSRYNVYCSASDKITHHKVNLSWYNASQYCLEENNNLATIAEINTDRLKHSGWIGLYQQADKNWDWIGDLSSNYRNWAPGEPLTADCGSYNVTTEKWYSKKCSQELQVVCSADNLVVVNENKTWEKALKHCREMNSGCAEPCMYYYDLLSLPDSSEYSYIRDRIYRATTDEVWVGLRFLAGQWWWMNGAEVRDQGMLTKCPAGWNRCGILSKKDTNHWNTRDCSERRNFICYKRRSSSTV